MSIGCILLSHFDVIYSLHSTSLASAKLLFHSWHVVSLVSSCLDAVVFHVIVCLMHGQLLLELTLPDCHTECDLCVVKLSSWAVIQRRYLECNRMIL